MNPWPRWVFIAGGAGNPSFRVAGTEWLLPAHSLADRVVSAATSHHALAHFGPTPQHRLNKRALAMNPHWPPLATSIVPESMVAGYAGFYWILNRYLALSFTRLCLARSCIYGFVKRQQLLATLIA